MLLNNKKFIFLSGLLGVLVLAGVLGFLLINVQKTQADIPGGPACLTDVECRPPYWEPIGNSYCSTAWGPFLCSDVEQCSNCAASFPSVKRLCEGGTCKASIYGGPYINCWQCYDEGNPPYPPQPTSCVVGSQDFNYALYFKAPNGNTQFAITDSGHLLGKVGYPVTPGVGDGIDATYAAFPDNNFPIYDGDRLLAFFHTDNNEDFLYLVLRGYVYPFEGSLSPQGSGNFIIKNNANMIVAYIDNQGNLYLMGCVYESEYEF